MSAAFRALVIFVPFVLLANKAIAQKDSLPQPKIEFKSNADGVDGLILTIVVHGVLEPAWQILSHPDAGPKLFSNVISIRPSAKSSTTWRYHLDSLIGEKVLYCRVNLDAVNRILHWKRQHGDLAAFEGFFKLSPIPGKPNLIHVTYESYIDPGGIGSVLMTNRRREKMVREMIPRLRRLLAPKQPD